MTSHLQLEKKTQHAQQVSKRFLAFADYPTLKKDDVTLSEKGLSRAQQERARTKIHDYLHTYKDTLLGYQNTQNVGGDMFKNFSNLHINNAGDPFVRGNYGANTKVLECAVLDYFGKLWHIDLPDSVSEEKRDEAYWGYIVSMGCTEANLYALYNARDYLSGEPLLCSETKESCNAKPCQADNGAKCPHCIAFFSESAHYGQNKAMRILRINTFHELGSGHFPCPLTYPEDYPMDYCAELLDQNGWPRLVPVNADETIHVPSLVKLVSAFTSRGYPPIVIFTSGTPFRGSYDDTQVAIDKLVPVLKEHGLYERHVHYSSKDPSKYDIRRGFWFHSDGALGAAHLPFLEMAIEKGAIENEFPDGFPVFDFRIPEVMSISMSFHKWLGCPFPSGVYMTKRKNRLEPPGNPFFIGGGDTTFSGSRNGHGAMAMWDLLSKKSYEDLVNDAVKHANVVAFAFKLLRELEKDLGDDLWLSHSPGSLFICLKPPKEEIVVKYSLASHVVLVQSKRGKIERKIVARICVMAHVDQELIEEFVEELRQPGAFPSRST